MHRKLVSASPGAIILCKFAALLLEKAPPDLGTILRCVLFWYVSNFSDGVLVNINEQSGGFDSKTPRSLSRSVRTTSDPQDHTGNLFLRPLESYSFVSSLLLFSNFIPPIWEQSCADFVSDFSEGVLEDFKSVRLTYTTRY